MFLLEPNFFFGHPQAWFHYGQNPGLCLLDFDFACLPHTKSSKSIGPTSYPPSVTMSTATDNSLWLMIPEKFLYNVERSDIGRKLLISAVFPFLCIRIVCETFHASGIQRTHTWEYILASGRPLGSRALRWRYSRPSGLGDVLDARGSWCWISFSLGGELRTMTWSSRSPGKGQPQASSSNLK